MDPPYWATPWAPGPMHKWKHLCPSKRVNSIDQLPHRCSAQLDEVQPTRASLVLADDGLWSIYRLCEVSLSEIGSLANLA
jgi:hypothetical protein